MLDKKNKSDLTVAIFVRNYGSGGVERVSLNLYKSLLRLGIKVDLVSNHQGFCYDERLEQIRNTNGVVIFSRLRDIPHIIFKAKKYIYWRHLPLRVGTRGLGGRVFEVATLIILQFFVTIVTVCPELKANLNRYGILNHRSRTGFAPLDQSLLNSEHQTRSTSRVIKLFHYTRRGTQKRTLDLIRLIGVIQSGLKLKLTIIGDGANDYEGTDYVETIAAVDDPLPVLRSCHALVMCSRYEGFPTAMIEAASQGLPIITNEFSTGLVDFEKYVGNVSRYNINSSISLLNAIIQATSTDPNYTLKQFDQLAIEQWQKILAI